MSESNGVNLAELDMGGKRLRPYQISLIEKVRAEVARGHRSVIICSGTGSGKTLTASALLKLCADKGKYGMFMAPRRELIKQSSRALDDAGVRHSILAAGFDWMPGGDVIIASKDTLAARTLRRSKMPLPTIDLLVSDECHQIIAVEGRKLVEALRKQNPRLVTVGLSATPGRSDGKGLGDLFDAIVTACSYAELQEQGFLVGCRVFAPDAPDMRGVRQKDWDSEAAARVDRPKLVGDVVKHWKEHASDRPTIVFGATIAHSIHLRDEFLRVGVTANHIDQSTPTEDRDQIIDDLKRGRIQVLCNCSVLTYGFDEPSVSCIVIVSPSRSLVQYRQRAGRGMRPSPDTEKTDLVILDHAGAVHMHGFPDEDIEWPLEKSRSIDAEYQAKRKEGKTREPMVCTNCHCVFSGRPDCPNCGSRHQRKGRDIAIAKGLLKEVKRKKETPADMSGDQLQRYWHKCLAVMARRGRTCGAAARMYSHAVGSPPWKTPGLTNMPRDRGDWKRPVADVFPQYLRG